MRLYLFSSGLPLKKKDDGSHGSWISSRRTTHTHTLWVLWATSDMYSMCVIATGWGTCQWQIDTLTYIERHFGDTYTSVGLLKKNLKQCEIHCNHLHIPRVLIRAVGELELISAKFSLAARNRTIETACLAWCINVYLYPLVFFICVPFSFESCFFVVMKFVRSSAYSYSIVLVHMQCGIAQ